jgi:hypothetical protein
MKTKLVLKIAGLIDMLALISTCYCFWLMTVPLSYHWVPAVLIGFVVSIGVFVISLATHLSSSHDCVDHLVRRMLRRSGRLANQPAKPPVTYAKRIR